MRSLAELQWELGPEEGRVAFELQQARMFDDRVRTVLYPPAKLEAKATPIEAPVKP